MPTILLQPVVVARGNIKETVVKDGFQTLVSINRDLPEGRGFTEDLIGRSLVCGGASDTESRFCFSWVRRRTNGEVAASRSSLRSE